MPLSISTDRFRAVAAVSVMLCAALWVTGCANPGSSTPRTSVTTVTVTPSGASVPATGSPPANPDASPAVANGVSPSLAKALTAVLSQQPGSVGVAIGPVGGDLPAQAFGDLDTDVAWSTIKVPLALAAQRAGGRMALSAITEAIVNSDNAAAEQLWSMLGTPAQAAAAVQRVLAESGDTKTGGRVATRALGIHRIRPNRVESRRYSRFRVAAALPVGQQECPHVDAGSRR